MIVFVVPKVFHFMKVLICNGKSLTAFLTDQIYTIPVLLKDLKKKKILPTVINGLCTALWTILLHDTRTQSQNIFDGLKAGFLTYYIYTPIPVTAHAFYELIYGSASNIWSMMQSSLFCKFVMSSRFWKKATQFLINLVWFYIPTLLREQDETETENG